jgi:chromosomal replication initiator protein
VVGESNRLAAAAARNVAERPGAAYNPLFIYGGVGLGKTHLLQAIGNHCLATHRAVRVHYAAAETVFIELIQAIERNSRLEFKSRYRGLNVLLLDDIHYLIGKERLQEEIFHIFNYLHDAGSQIVFTSDRPPRDIPTLEERLISRLGSGLVVDIQPPDIETRSAILMRRAAQEHVELPEDVRLYIAHRIKTNVRALEGSLVRLMAMASLEARPLTVPLAEAALRDIVPQEPQIDQNRVLSVVADHYQVPVSEICGTRRTKQLALARQVAMHQMRSLLAYSLKEIGHHCGRRDHSTVIHGIAKIERLRTQDPAFAAKLTSISTKIGKR